MKILLKLFIILSIQSCTSQTKKETTSKESIKIIKTNAEWQQILSPMAYYVLRESGTEKAFSSSFNTNEAYGTYVCTACKSPLFKSDHKFDSGSGWPSFDRAIEGQVAYTNEGSSEFYGIEEHCATCGGHLGHVFSDGPKNTTGKRHCINGVALDFIPNP